VNSQTISSTHKLVNDLSSRHVDQGHDVKVSKILEWLSPMDYGGEQGDILSIRQPGTGQWLLDTQQFQLWLQKDQQSLFRPGIPGAGKTVLTSIVVEHL